LFYRLKIILLRMRNICKFRKSTKNFSLFLIFLRKRRESETKNIFVLKNEIRLFFLHKRLKMIFL